MFTEVADRVLVARYPQWDVTVGLVLGRDGAVLVDTRGSAAQGDELARDVARLGRGVRVSHVVNTHVHFDHTFGNVAFGEATIHAHENVAARLDAEAMRVWGELRADPGDAPEYGYTAQDAADVLATTLRGPERTFSRSATIDLGDRAVTLSYAGRGHTDGDIAIHVADADVLFLGDLVEESAHPSFGADCWPLDWAETLTSHLVWVGEDTVVVPGHGAPVDLSFVERQRDEVAAVATVIRERHTTGVALGEAQREADARLPYPLPWLRDAFTRGWAQLGR